jgi:hypothetical protein
VHIFIVPAGTLLLPLLWFFRAFSSVVRQMPGYNPQRRGTGRTLPKILCCSIHCFVSFCVLFVCKCVLYYCYRVATQLQLNISCHIAYHISYHIIYHITSYHISYHIISYIISHHIIYHIYSIISYHILNKIQLILQYVSFE